MGHQLPEKSFVFKKTYFKVKVFKTFKICRHRHIKTCQFLKQRGISKIPSTAFRET